MATIKGSFQPDDDVLVSYEITDEQKDRIIERLLKYYKKHAYIGEVIFQDDDSIIYAPDVLADICDDIIVFKHKELA